MADAPTRIFSSKSSAELKRLAEAPTSINQLRQKLGRANLLDSTKIVLLEAAESELPKATGITYYGWISESAGKPITGSRGRVIIKLSTDALSSLESAVKTVGHELHHLGEILAGSGPNEFAAEKAAEAFWKTFLSRLT